MTQLTEKLPIGIVKSDLVAPKWDDKDGFCKSFDMWFVPSFGWCIPTLLISRASRRAPIGTPDRYYAIRISDGGTVRIGMGPHVKDRVRVHLRKSRMKDLQKFVDMQGTGAENANTIRDRISTRRANGALRRNSIFGW